MKLLIRIRDDQTSCENNIMGISQKLDSNRNKSDSDHTNSVGLL